MVKGCFSIESGLPSIPISSLCLALGESDGYVLWGPLRRPERWGLHDNRFRRQRIACSVELRRTKRALFAGVADIVIHHWCPWLIRIRAAARLVCNAEGPSPRVVNIAVTAGRNISNAYRCPLRRRAAQVVSTLRFSVGPYQD